MSLGYSAKWPLAKLCFTQDKYNSFKEKVIFFLNQRIIILPAIEKSAKMEIKRLKALLHYALFYWRFECLTFFSHAL